MLHIYSGAIKGFAARLPTGAADALQQNPLVAFVEPDEVIRADVTQTMDANGDPWGLDRDRKSTRLNSSHSQISYAVFCLKKKKNTSILHCDLCRSISTCELA